MDNIHQISAAHLTIEQIGEIIKDSTKLELSEDARQRIIRCRAYLDKKIIESDTPIYGVTTGFGSLCKIPSTKTVCHSCRRTLSCPMPVV